MIRTIGTVLILFFLHICNGHQSVEENVYVYSNISNTTLKVDDTTTAAQHNETSPKNSTQRFIQCLPNLGSQEVEIVNDTQLIKILTVQNNITSRDTPAMCVLVLFYSKYCTFSSMAAPHFNALPRAFPDIKTVAINAMIYHFFNTQNGIVGLPSLLLFHNGKPVAKFNDSDYTLELFSKFITKFTSIHPQEKSTVISSDFAGPVTSTPSKDSDILLILSWLFVISCALYYFTQSQWWAWIIESIKNNWRESEAQAHLHTE